MCVTGRARSEPWLLCPRERTVRCSCSVASWHHVPVPTSSLSRKNLCCISRVGTTTMVLLRDEFVDVFFSF